MSKNYAEKKLCHNSTKTTQKDIQASHIHQNYAEKSYVTILQKLCQRLFRHPINTRLIWIWYLSLPTNNAYFAT